MVNRLYDFYMVVSKLVLVQVHDLQVLIHQVISESHTLEEAFQISSIIAMLAMTWKKTRNELVRKNKTLDL